jgi:hypothetical protein
MTQREYSYEELTKLLRINKHALDDAWLEQPDLLFNAATKLAYAISERDQLAQELKEAEARADTELRKAARNSESKITDKEVESRRRLDKTYLRIQKDFTDKSLEVGLLFALKEAFSHRKDALESLVKLYLAQYFGAQVEDDSGQMRERLASRAKRAQADMRRNRS